MNKSVWDLYARIYEKAMRMDQKYYRYMYDRIPVLIQDKVVLEIAAGQAYRLSTSLMLQKVSLPQIILRG